MTRIITAREATVKTATVDVKALTISGRQVTLSVFRQLKDAPLLDEETVALGGVPWGIVNYFWGTCAKSTEHLHVVWQKGEELRRACVWPKPSSATGWARRNAAVERLSQAYVWAMIAEKGNAHGIEQEDVDYSSERRFALALFDRWVYVRMRWSPNVYFAETVSQAASAILQWPVTHRRDATEYRTALNAYMPIYDSDEAYERAYIAATERERQMLRTEARRLSGSTDPSEIERSATDAVEVLNDFEQRWRDQYAALAELDHLFIAV
jgi:hypothetical protein